MVVVRRHTDVLVQDMASLHIAAVVTGALSP